MAVPHWIFQMLTSGLTSEAFKPLGDKTANLIGNAGIDSLVTPLIGAMDATGPRNAAFGTKLGNTLTGQSDYWDTIYNANRGLQPRPATTTVTPGNNPIIQMPLGG